ncbi:MAG: hypothetical protein R3236_10760, partial [Phycisphaeraceae bacterium]|nr:hypothetical protein [Phycisphaeraceae bacterium]
EPAAAQPPASQSEVEEPPLVDVVSIEPPRRQYRPKQSPVKVETLSASEVAALSPDPQDPAEADGDFKAYGPQQRLLELLPYNKPWARFCEARGRRLEVTEGHRSLIFRIRPDGYTPAVKLGGTDYAGRYRLIDQAGRSHPGSIVGFVGRQDVVKFEIPLDLNVEGGRIEVVDPALKVSDSNRP